MQDICEEQNLIEDHSRRHITILNERVQYCNYPQVKLFQHDVYQINDVFISDKYYFESLYVGIKFD